MGAGEGPDPCPVLWPGLRGECRVHSALRVSSHVCSKGGQAQPQALPANLSDGGDEQEPHSKLSKCGRNRTPQQVSGHLQATWTKPISFPQGAEQYIQQKHMQKATTTDVSAKQKRMTVLRPDPNEAPKACPLNQKDMRKLLDLQMVTYNALLPLPISYTASTPCPISPSSCSPSKKQAERKSLLVTASSQTIRCLASPCQHPQLTHYCIPSYFSLKTG